MKSRFVFEDFEFVDSGLAEGGKVLGHRLVQYTNIDPVTLEAEGNVRA